MEAGKQNCTPANRRRFIRWSVYNFIHATAALSDSMSIEQISERRAGRPWIGPLADISNDGAQVILPCGCEKYLRENQQILMRLKTTLRETDIDVAARIKSITPDDDLDAMHVGVQFSGLENNTKASDAITRICKYGEKLKAVKAT